ncbi:hypothetical protein ACQBAU_14160 [Propionibacteriaceae bacterium Y2011]
MTSSAGEEARAASESEAARKLAEIQAAVAAAPNTVLTSEDKEVEVELTAELVVTRVTLRATATRDRQKLEDSLVQVFTDAIRQAQESNPAQQMAKDAMGGDMATFQKTMSEIQGEMEAKSQAARAHFDEMGRRLQAIRQQQRPPRS